MRSTLLPHTPNRCAASLDTAAACIVRRLLRYSAALAVVLGLMLSASAQEYNKNKPDQALKADARVDPSTLGMSLGVPLGGAPGRAGASLPISLRYSSKLWRLQGGAPFTNTGGIKHTWAYPKYSENSMAGWTSSLEPPRIEFTGEEQLFGSNGQPLGGGIDDQESYGYYVRRIHLHLSDGSSHELRKDDSTPGFPLDNPVYDFSGTYYAVDGSRTRFDYDANSDTGVLYLPDSGRYHFGARQTVTRYGHAQERSWGTTYIDRHGNTMTYNMGTGVWTDTLGRTFTNPLFNEPAIGIQDYPVPGVNGNDLIYKLHWKSLSNALRVSGATSYVSNTRCVSPTTYQSISPYLFTSGGNNVHVCTPTGAGGSPVPFNPVVLARVELPNGQFYDFKYNVWGEIEQMIAPGGGYERYSYAQVATLSRANPPYDQANRGVVERWVSPSGTGAEEATHHWSYSITKSTGHVAAMTTEPDGTRSERFIYANSFGTQYGFETPLAGMSYDERVYNSSNQMLRRTLTGWSTVTPSGSTRPRNPHVTKTVGLILDTGGNALSSTTTMAYDGDLNVTAKNSYSYASFDQTTAQTGAIGSIPGGAPARTDETTYLVNDANISTATRDAYRGRNMVGLPSSTRVKNAAGTIVAQSEVKYDEAAYPLLSYGAVVGWNDPGTSVRGNATTTRSWLDTSNTWIETHGRYDQVGNLRYSWDAKGNMSEVEYSSVYHYAYPTHTKSAVPDPTNNRATNTALETWTAYDATSGKVISTTDANSKTTVLKYTYIDQYGQTVRDALDRLRKVEMPDGGWTMYEYGRNVYGDYVATRTAINATQNTEGYDYFDGLGRSVRSFQSEGSQSITIDTQYDAMGRVWRVSNPYLSAGAGAAVNPSGHWTTTAYDALGRVSTVTTPDSAVVSTSYSGAQVTVTDQVGKTRRSVSDALGRLTQVVEDPAGVAYQTIYLYDVLGNLRKVDQGGQLRFFMYDSLSRLVRARNPEQAANAGLTTSADPVSGNTQWSLSYAYDNNGNLSSKTDARGVTTTHQYDNINRLKQTNYSDGTPYTLRTYDFAQTNGRGRFYANYESSTSGTINFVDGYDSMGRPTSGRTEFFLAGAGWRPAYTYSRNYNLMGGVTQQTYPSLRTVNYSQFDVAGRLKQFNGNLGDGTPRTYSTGIEYDEAGRLKLEQFGTGTALNHKRGYNVRGQMCQVGLGTPNTTDRGQLLFYYSQVNGYSGCASGPDNNGNVVLSQHWVPNNPQVGGWQWFNQYYTYDSLNRIVSVREEQNAQTTTGEQHFTYDRWGNRQINAAATYNNNPSLPFNEKQFDARDLANTNRLYAPGDLDAGKPESLWLMRYDPAGNLIEDRHTGAGARTYDAEYRMTSAATGINSSSYYTYDADGRRMRRQNSNEAAVWQVYGFEGELLAEYTANAAPTSPQKEYGYRNGELLITAEDATAAQPVGWMNAVNVVAGSGGNLSKPANGASDWSAGAMSTRAIASGDGYVEFSAPENNTSRMIGLSHGDSHQSYTDIDFALYAYSDGNMYVYEQGGYVTNLGPYAAGDRYRVSIEAGVVKYRKNGTAIYNSARAARYPLLADTSFYTPGASLGGVLMAGRQVENVGWTNAVGVTATGNNLSKAGADAWTSGAVSQASIAAGDGYVEYTATETNKSRMLGLSNGDSGQSYTDIDFALYTYWDSTLHVYEGGAYIGYLGTYAAGDRLRVAVEGGQVKYLRNGVVVGVSSRAVTYPLLADAALYNTGATLTNVVMSGTVQSGSAVQWLVTDHLGTPRMVADLTGSLIGIKRHDYLPFGEEIGAGVGGRTQAQGYAGDNVRQQFTGYERDDETRLDYAQARYYASAQGRFTSPDPLLSSGKLIVPQSWNRYSYVLNNPLMFIDPTGLEWRKHDKDGGIKWYGDDDDRTDTTEYTNEYYQDTNDRWVHLNPNGPTRDSTAGDFTRRGWVHLNASDVPSQYNSVNANAPGLSDNMSPEAQAQGNARNVREIALEVGGIYNEDNGIITPGPNSSFGIAVDNLQARGFTWFADYHPAHFGGDDYEGQVNNTWYHTVVGRPNSQSGDTNIMYLLRPPSFIQAFPQRHYYRPSGMHRLDWLCGPLCR